jgi:hypothetical protein
MKFFGVADKANEPTANVRRAVLRSACTAKGIDYVDVAGDKAILPELPRPDPRDIVYKMTRGAHALESWFISQGVTSFWTDSTSLNVNLADTSTVWAIAHDAHGLSAPKTVHYVTNERHQLTAAARYIGGYPLILKVAGGSLGLGVVRIDTQEGLFSTADFVAATGKPFILREFIADARDVRAVVVGDRVVKIYGYETQAGDFRSNPMGQVTRRSDQLSEAACRDAIEAVRLIGASAGAVDFRVTSNGDHYLLEVNLPFGLSADDDDVALEMVEHLIAKSDATGI